MNSLQLLKSMGFTAIEIPLKHRRFAIIDIDDAPRILELGWVPVKSGKTMLYARARTRIGGRSCKKVLMHRLIFDADPSQDIDHRDGNGLNNRRYNLRSCSESQNLANMRHLRSDSSSGFKGVHFVRKLGKWQARVQFRGKRISLGLFATRELAAKAYDEGAKRIFGEFAATNAEIRRR